MARCVVQSASKGNTIKYSIYAGGVLLCIGVYIWIQIPGPPTALDRAAEAEAKRKGFSNPQEQADAERKKWQAESERLQAERNEAAALKAKQQSKKTEAWVMAQEFVTKSLATPSTASFGGAFSDQGPNCVTSLGNGVYRVNGWVDAQNRFGAMIRSDFSVTVKDEGNDQWSLVSEPKIEAR
jgi:hypothetical protein